MISIFFCLTIMYVTLLECVVTNSEAFGQRSKEDFKLLFKMQSAPFPIIKQFHNPVPHLDVYSKPMLCENTSFSCKTSKLTANRTCTTENLQNNFNIHLSIYTNCPKVTLKCFPGINFS